MYIELFEVLEKVDFYYRQLKTIQQLEPSQVQFLIDLVIKFKNKQDLKLPAACLTHIIYIFTGLFRQILELKLNTQLNSRPLISKFLNSGLKIEDYFSFFFEFSEIITFFKKTFIEITNPNSMDKFIYVEVCRFHNVATPQDMDKYLNFHGFIIYVENISFIIRAITKLEAQIKVYYPESFK